MKELNAFRKFLAEGAAEYITKGKNNQLYLDKNAISDFLVSYINQNKQDYPNPKKDFKKPFVGPSHIRGYVEGGIYRYDKDFKKDLNNILASYKTQSLSNQEIENLIVKALDSHMKMAQTNPDWDKSKTTDTPYKAI